MTAIDRKKRFHADDLRHDTRKPFQRDRDRILYTSAFRRLAWVTQVVSSEEGEPFHNRLTHTLEVAQIGRRLAENLKRNHQDKAKELGGIAPDVVEAAALAHDLGHPPFGHIAEKELDKLVVEAGVPDGFEGNAQSFRIVTKLAMRRPEFSGLNLTRASLNAILKYPWFRQLDPPKRNRKWGAYTSEKEEFEWVRKLGPGYASKCLEAEIMEWADDIAYAVHDVEDFYRVGRIPLDRLTNDDEEVDRFLDGAYAILEKNGEPCPPKKSDCKASLKNVLRTFRITEPFSGTRHQRARLRAMTAQLIGGYVSAITLRQCPNQDNQWVEMACRKRVSLFVFKQLIWHYVIENADLATQQYGQRRIVRDLFDIFNCAAAEKRLQLFPERHRESLEEIADKCGSHTNKERIRIVTDFIAGMTDQQAVSMHQRLTGVSLGTVMNSIVR